MAKGETQNDEPPPKKYQKNYQQKIPLEPKSSDINTFVPKTTPKQPGNKQTPTPKQPEHSFETNTNQLNKNYDKNNQNICIKLPKRSYQTTTNRPIFYYAQEPSVNSWQTKLGQTNQPTQEPCLTTEEVKTSIIQMMAVVKDLLIETVTEEVKEEEEKLKQEEEQKSE